MSGACRAPGRSPSGLPTIVVLSVALAAAGACRNETAAPPPQGGAPAAASAPAGPGARPVALPDLSRVEQGVQEQAKERYAALQEALANPAVPPAGKGEAYGNLAMLLHAGEYYEAAEPAYLNAADLAPQDARWPYLLGHLHKSRGEPAKALADFTRALDLQPNDVPTLVWLGRLYLDQGQPEKAQPLFERARMVAPRVVAGIVGLGQAALAQRDYARAVTVLEEALRVQPSLSSVHSPLAMAYRGLGDIPKAEAHLKEWRNIEVLVPDPVRQQLDLALQSGLSFELRGVRALEAASAATSDDARQKSLAAAEDAFRRGIEMAPGETMLGRSLRHKLATALALQGDVQGAYEQFTDVVRLAPRDEPDETAAKAHYSIGVLMASAGRGREAVTHLSAAVKFNANYLEARLALGDALSRAGRPQPALAEYAEVIRLNPRAAEARFGYTMALVRLKRFKEARDWLDESTRLLPDDLQLRHARARLMAAAPDPAARDGRQALAIMQQLLQQLPPENRTTQLGETLAMAHAEVGNFGEAAATQRGVLNAASSAGFNADVRRMTANLGLYERGQPCRTPWQPNETVFSPGPPISPELGAVLAPGRR
jgi:tetratricopeptide (TPR) repeat protein